jgi:hypothetical protein
MSARKSECCEKKNAHKYFEIAANMAASMSMELSRRLDKMNAEELRSLTATLIAQLAERDAERSAHAAQIAGAQSQATEERPAHARDGYLKALALRSAQRAARCRTALAPG